MIINRSQEPCLLVRNGASMQKVLFICPHFTQLDALSMRVVELARFAKQSWECHLLADGPPDWQPTSEIFDRVFWVHHSLLSQLGLAAPKPLSRMLEAILRRVFYLVRGYGVRTEFCPRAHLYAFVLFGALLRERYDRVAIHVPEHGLYTFLTFESVRKRALMDVCDPYSRPQNEPAKRFEKDHLSRAPRIVVTNHATRDFFIKELELLPSTVAVIPQGVNLNIFEPQAPRPGRESKSVRLLYGGAFYGGQRKPWSLIEALLLSNKVGFDFSLDVYGGFQWDEGSQERLRNVDPAIRVHEKITQALFVKAAQRHDAVIFIDNDVPLQTPGKIYELIAWQKPVLFIKGREESEAYQLAAAYPHFVFCENEVEALRNGLFRLEARLSQKDDDENAKPEVSSYSWEARGSVFLSLLEEHSI